MSFVKASPKFFLPRQVSTNKFVNKNSPITIFFFQRVGGGGGGIEIFV